MQISQSKQNEIYLYKQKYGNLFLSLKENISSDVFDILTNFDTIEYGYGGSKQKLLYKNSYFPKIFTLAKTYSTLKSFSHNPSVNKDLFLECIFDRIHLYGPKSIEIFYEYILTLLNVKHPKVDCFFLLLAELKSNGYPLGDFVGLIQKFMSCDEKKSPKLYCEKFRQILTGYKIIDGAYTQYLDGIENMSCEDFARHVELLYMLLYPTSIVKEPVLLNTSEKFIEKFIVASHSEHANTQLNMFQEIYWQEKINNLCDQINTHFSVDIGDIYWNVFDYLQDQLSLMGDGVYTTDYLLIDVNNRIAESLELIYQQVGHFITEEKKTIFFDIMYDFFSYDKALMFRIRGSSDDIPGNISSKEIHKKILCGVKKILPQKCATVKNILQTIVNKQNF